MTEATPLIPVHLRCLPVPLAGRARQHFEGLVREFELISASSADEHHAPTRLMRLVDTLTAAYGGLNTAADDQLEDALDQGVASLDDHVLEVPLEAGPATRMLAEMLEEADDYCRRGQHLLTVATPPDCVAYRRWYLGQIQSQLNGDPPLAWPDSPQAADLRD